MIYDVSMTDSSNAGYLYVLTNPAMLDLVKIGVTTGIDPETNAPVTTVAGTWISKERPAGHGGLDLGVSGHKGNCQVAIR